MIKYKQKTLDCVSRVIHILREFHDNVRAEEQCISNYDMQYL